MKKTAKLCALIAFSACAMSIIMFMFLLFPVIAGYALIGLFFAITAVMTWDHFSPFQEGTKLHFVVRLVKVPSLFLLAAGLAGFLTLSLFAGPLIWGMCLFFGSVCWLISGGAKKLDAAVEAADRPLSCEEVVEMNDLNARFDAGTLGAREKLRRMQLNARMRNHGADAPAAA